MSLVRGVWLAAVWLGAACSGNAPQTKNPDDPGLPVGAAEDDASAAPTVGDNAQSAKLLPSVQDRDPEAEKKKMAKSRQQSAAARVLLAKGQLQAAIEASRGALRIHEQNVDAMLVIAEAYFKQSKWEITLAVTSSALAVDAKIRTPAETSRIHNLRAFAFDKMGKAGLATESFREAAEADDKNAAAWNNLGTRYLAAGDAATAAGCFEYALELDPKFAKAYVNSGAALRANGKLTEAEKAFVRALELQPDYAAAYFNLGILYLDADPFPGMETTQRLNKSIEFLSKYQRSAGSALVAAGASGGKPSAQPVSRERADDYIRVAKKGLEREKRRSDRDAKRATQSDASTAASDGEGDAPIPTSPDSGKPTPIQPGAPSKPGATPSEPAQPAPSKPDPSKPAPSKPAPTKPTQPAPTKPQPVKPEPVKPEPIKPG